MSSLFLIFSSFMYNTKAQPRPLVSILPLIPPVTSALVQLFWCETACNNHLVSGVGESVDAGRCVDVVLIYGEQALMGIRSARERSWGLGIFVQQNFNSRWNTPRVLSVECIRGAKNIFSVVRYRRRWCYVSSACSSLQMSNCCQEVSLSRVKILLHDIQVQHWSYSRVIFNNN